MARDGIVHVIDDDLAVRKSLAFLLATANLTVRVYDSGSAFLDALPGVAAGCVVTDVRMPGLDGIELLRRLAASGAQLPVIVMTGHADVPLAVQAMKLGAVDLLEKPFDDDRFIAAVEAALDARPTAPTAPPPSPDLDMLSPRERQVLDGVLEGKANKVIARELGLSFRTVEVYRAKLMAKLDADSLPDLVRKTLASERERHAGEGRRPLPPAGRTRVARDPGL